jgi:large repetitive protein
LTTAGPKVARAVAALVAASVMLAVGLTGVANAAEAPVLAINQPAPGSFTKDLSPTFSGTTDDVLDSIILKIYEGSNASGVPVQISGELAPAPIGPSEATWEITPVTPLAQGEYTAVVEQINAESVAGESPPVTFSVDTTAPNVSIQAPATPTKDATPTLTGGVGVEVGDDPGVSVTIHEGNTLAGPVAASGAASLSAGSWSFTPGTLPDGTYTAQATQEDQAGNRGESAAVTFTVDTTPPAVSLTAPPAFIDNTTPTFSGGAGVASGDQASVTVTVYEGSSTAGKVAVSEVIKASGATWKFTPTSALAQGTYTVQATQADSAGNLGTSSAATFVIDTTAPNVTINPVSTPTNDAVPTFSGSAGELSGDQASVTVTIFHGIPKEEHVAQSVGVSVSGGGWSYTASPALSEGEYTVQVSQRDAAGNLTTRQVAFTIDTAAPVVSLTAVPTPSKNQTPKLVGTGGVAKGDHSSVTVDLYKGEAATGTPIESTSAAVTSGAWSHAVPTLTDGTYTAQATQEDSAGNVGKSAAVTFTVDTTAPAVAINPVKTPTNQKTPTITGVAGVASGDLASVTVTVYKGALASGEVLESKAVTPSGASWAFTLGKALPEGTYTAQATQEDKAGNLGKSAAVTFSLDTTPPVVSVEVPSVSQVFHSSQPTFTGSAGVAAGDSSSVMIQVYKGKLASGTPAETLVAAREGGHWKAFSSKELENGEYVLEVEQSDVAGNVGVSSAVPFEVVTKLSLNEFGLVQAADQQTEFLTGPEPSFDGTAASGPGSSPTVTVTIYSGLSVSGPKARVMALTRSGTRWTSAPVSPALPDGEYTVRATQGLEVSAAFTFTVDADAPAVTLTSPPNGSSTLATAERVSGSLGTATGDKPEATVKLYSGSQPGGAVLQAKTVGSSEGLWSTTFEALEPGTYTAQAEQSDDVGNVGRSGPVAFTVLAPPVLGPSPPPSPPVASFRWVPAAPHPGEPVTLISTSTDAAGAIGAFAWAPAGDGAFAPGEATLTTTFATAGAHVVQLRVTDGGGQSSTVAETIPVTVAPPVLMQPFPVVRIAGSFTSSGARISLLTVLAPVGATVKVTCRGGGCATKSQLMIVASGAKSKAGTVLVNFRRFERSLRAGAVLDVWVSGNGQIGKFTRFLIRRGKPPTRTDTCLSATGTKPIVCPA